MRRGAWKMMGVLAVLVCVLVALRPGVASASRQAGERRLLASRWGAAPGPGAGVAIPPTRAQGADFFEDFDNNGPTNPGDDGPSNLIAAGWTFRNQSVPEGDLGWFDGTVAYLPPQAGPGYLAANYQSVANLGTISNWAILPEIPGLDASDVLSLWTISGSTGNPDRLQVRYSPSGGTSTGAGAFAVGDFTTVLLDLNPVPNNNDPNADENGWLQHEIPMPGSGRIALRYFVQDGGLFGSASTYLGVDSLGVNVPPPPPPCVPELPAPGQTVTWQTEDSPIEVCTTVTIPVGGTVLVEPGVEIQVQEGATLVVEGRLRGEGTQAAPIVVTGGNSIVEPPIRVLGTLDLSFLRLQTRIVADSGSSTLVSDCEIEEGGTVYGLDTFYSFQEPKYIQVERCASTGGDVVAWDSTLVARDLTFDGGGFLSLNRGYLWVDDVTLNGAPLSVYRDDGPQPLYINNVRATDVATGGAFFLETGNYFLGPDNVMQGSLYPVHVEGGLLPGSTVPATGNSNNYIFVGDADFFYGSATWADLGVPYVVEGYSYIFTPITILPGTTVKFARDSGIGPVGRFNAEGLPDKPIHFEPLVPGQRWTSLAYNSNGSGPRLDYVTVEGSNYGVVASDSLVRLSNSLIQNNLQGGAASTYGSLEVEKSRFLDNGTGIFLTDLGSADLYHPGNPNAFEGNGAAIEAESPAEEDARGNWWGDPTGPQHPDNPGGQGDPVTGTGAGGVDVTPFLTAPPNFDNQPPVVRATEPYFFVEPGQTILLEWTAADDDTIVEQRILFSDFGNYEYDEVVVEGLPGDQRSFQWTVPDVGTIPSSAPFPFVRIEAVDSAGQVGWDEFLVDIPVYNFNDTIEVRIEPGPFVVDERVEVCWEWEGTLGGTVDAALLLDGDREGYSLGGAHTGVNCLSLPAAMPPASTDTARIALRLNAGASNNFRWFFSDEFTIRPDPRVGDAPPTVTMVTPNGGAVFEAGEPIEISWTAADDGALRSFDIQASYDGGLAWQLIAENLPATATNFLWDNAPNANLDDVRVRVIARDMYFQNTSDGAARSFAIEPGTPGPSPTATATGSATPTQTATATSSASPTRTPSATPTGSATPTPTLTPTGSAVVPSPTRTPSPTPSATVPASATPTATATWTATPTGTQTVTPTGTATPTGTRTVTPTPTAVPPGDMRLFLPLVFR